MFFLESYILIPILVTVSAIIIVLMVIKGRKNSSSKTKLEKAKATNRDAVIREANKRLAQNPKDPAALLYLAEIHYNEKNWDKALKLYDVLLELCAMDSELDEFTITLRHAVCALNAKQYKTAYNDFMVARTMKSDEFIINYNLGYLEFMRKNYEKAIGFLMQARNQKSDDANTYRYLGLSLYKSNRYNDAIDALRKDLELEPDNKEAMFALGESYYNLGQNDAALRTFANLRTDPKYGPNACIYAGTISTKFRNFDQAAMYFEIGLKSKNLKAEVALELRYRLANSFIKAQKISEAIKPLQEIYGINSEYKDVAALLKKYGELNSNANLQVYLMGPIAQFISLCRKISGALFPKTRIKVLEISTQQNEYIDLLAEIVTSKWEDIVLFRYMRTSGQVGELVLRDLYGKIKEVKAGRGICVSAGTFSPGAKTFVEARLIDLLEKDDLLKLLDGINQPK